MKDGMLNNQLCDILEKSGFQVNYLNMRIQTECGRRVIRFYDLDNHIIEVGEPL